MKVNLKQKKGITLIALVITIVVLLILAGVTIAMLTGENGILGKATTAKAKSAEEEAREKVKYINSQNSSKVTRRLYLSKEEEDKEKIENADINKKEEQDLER